MKYRMILTIFVFMVAQASVNTTVSFAQNSQTTTVQNATVIEFSDTELWEFFQNYEVVDRYDDYYFCQEAQEICGSAVGFADIVKQATNKSDLNNGKQIRDFRSLQNGFKLLIPDSLLVLGSKSGADPTQNDKLDRLQDALDSGPKKSTQDSVNTDTVATSSAFDELEDNDAKIAHLRRMQVKQGRVMKRLYDTLQTQREQIASLQSDVNTQKDRTRGLREFLEGQDSDLRYRVERLEEQVAHMEDTNQTKKQPVSESNTSEDSTATDSGSPSAGEQTVIELVTQHWQLVALTFLVLVVLYFVQPREQRERMNAKISNLFSSTS